MNTSVSEGFPNTFTQAWLRRTPVLSLSFDPDSILANNAVGRISGDIGTLATDIREVISERRLRKKIGGTAKEHAIKNHSIETVVDQLEEAIQT